MAFNKSLHEFQERMFLFIIVLSWVLYIAIALGLWNKAPLYLNDLQYYTKIYVSLFLLLRFNPFRSVEFTDLDRSIAFSSGIFLLGTTFINSFLEKYLSKVKSSITNQIKLD